MDALQFPDFPDNPAVGTYFRDEEAAKIYRYLPLKSGAMGGFWGYANDPGSLELIVDIFFDANPRLAGRLTEKYQGQKFMWVLVKGWVVPPNVPRVFIEDKNEGRYERNRIDDVRYPKETEEDSDERHE